MYKHYTPRFDCFNCLKEFRMNKNTSIVISIVIPIGQINNEEQYITIEIIKSEKK